MSQEQDIKEMAQTICHRQKTDKNCGISNEPCVANCVFWHGIAADFYKAGYRKTSDVTKEIFKDIDYVLLMMFEEYASLGHREYSTVVKAIHHKLKALEKKYIETLI